MRYKFAEILLKQAKKEENQRRLHAHAEKPRLQGYRGIAQGPETSPVRPAVFAHEREGKGAA